MSPGLYDDYLCHEIEEYVHNDVSYHEARKDVTEVGLPT